MNTQKSLTRLIVEPTPTALSAAGYELLGRLQKGCAYQVNGGWRFRGLRSRVKETGLLSLRLKGLAECVETGRYPQFRITPAGRMIYRVHAREAAQAFAGGVTETTRRVAASALMA
jgi:hypothetical protein